mmetsp:Transcript_31051/g.83119  ORF Transcript_31051/g.83119 Transcript_31051/m.83119 type:complete len:271 (-) Transcript_31051:580-1392(-)
MPSCCEGYRPALQRWVKGQVRAPLHRHFGVAAEGTLRGVGSSGVVLRLQYGAVDQAAYHTGCRGGGRAACHDDRHRCDSASKSVEPREHDASGMHGLRGDHRSRIPVGQQAKHWDSVHRQGRPAAAEGVGQGRPDLHEREGGRPERDAASNANEPGPAQPVGGVQPCRGRGVRDPWQPRHTLQLPHWEEGEHGNAGPLGHAAVPGARAASVPPAQRPRGGDAGHRRHEGHEGHPDAEQAAQDYRRAPGGRGEQLVAAEVQGRDLLQHQRL